MLSATATSLADCVRVGLSGSRALTFCLQVDAERNLQDECSKYGPQLIECENVCARIGKPQLMKIQVPKAKALETMRRCLNEIADNSHTWNGYYSEGYKLWQKKTQTVLKNIFGANGLYANEFFLIRSAHSSRELTPEHFRRSVESSVSEARTLLSAAIQEVEDFVTEDAGLPMRTQRNATADDAKVESSTLHNVDSDKARRVWVVHGRNDKLRSSLFTYLRSIGLYPLEFSEARKLTGKPLPYVGEILEAAFEHAQAVVVLLTPDDEARLRPEFHAETDPEFEKVLTGQARPNVLFEAGMALVSHRDRTILLQVGDLRPFSDVAGRHVVHIDGSTQKRQELASRLESAGCLVSLVGTDWHTAGDFTLSPRSRSEVKSHESDGWGGLLKTIRIGDVIGGKVSRLAEFGVFVEIAEGIEALCHNSEATDQNGTPIKLRPGQRLNFVVIGIRPDEKKISVSLRAMGYHP